MSRRPHEVSSVIGSRVLELAKNGIPQEVIAVLEKIDTKTLKKYYQAELDEGMAHAKTFAIQSLFQNIRNGKEASLIFYLKTQLGWKETIRNELTGPDGVPLNQAVDAPPQETREQWIERISKEKALRLATSTGPAS